MGRNKKRFICNIFLCLSICLSLSYWSFASVMNDPHANALCGKVSVSQIDHEKLVLESGSYLESLGSLEALLQLEHPVVDMNLQLEAILKASLFSLRSVTPSQMRVEQVRKMLSFIFAILFKIALIPSLIYAVMGSSLISRTSLQKRILSFIQNMDGKKKPLAFI